MQYTPNYNFNLPEGSDLWNYLTQTNPNFSNLDTIIKGVSDLTVTPATEVTTGTAHAITKSLPDATVIKFTATSNWQTGDTMTLDGNPVTPLKTDGTTLKTGDYIIGSAVLMIQDGTRLTVLVASSPDAGDVNYTNDGTHSWLTANKVEGAINEAATEIDAINSNLSDMMLSGSYDTEVLIGKGYRGDYGSCDVWIPGFSKLYTISNLVLSWFNAGGTSINVTNEFTVTPMTHGIRFTTSNTTYIGEIIYVAMTISRR